MGRIGCALLIMLLSAFYGGAVYADDDSGNDDPRDPWEGLNRTIFAFNNTADLYVLEPVARGYRKVTPTIVDQSLANFFNNIGEIKNIANDTLQGKGGDVLVSSGRFVINTTVGVLGFFDVAGAIGLKRDSEDFGQTLAVWGVGDGPYLMIPFLGPSTLRDGFGRGVDSWTSVTRGIDPESAQYAMTLLDLLQVRASLLGTEELISGDKYTFFKDAYLQRREFLISDGEMKDDFGDEDFESFEF
ncbi:putative phospholipid-binding lipoprotein MlaA [Zhongshania aliphaticivorans]|uniref:Putative phospholipid-binding lipoprotein MlaA n=1 Tax=Zhongshania aliphaticivorans TaxID=1470434 RepID=A0A5S9QQD0_9GAMM|nr:VacJ family lipoprotein [Zhongshania aliphaticivorans]CAA0088126.1 putative phospholipid-binding lipoprotein MlaA [Zhongshania aliphaticivorans]CAA0115990.1 putative phospholipid-binding lipoprotein MlaA [Zhongshania aliphaticivorans]CAA0120360.1 putative phospholipid-binding lipoprotein MlaA [Zhongshania aliphaticivorans]